MLADMSITPIRLFLQSQLQHHAGKERNHDQRIWKSESDLQRQEAYSSEW